MVEEKRLFTVRIRKIKKPLVSRIIMHSIITTRKYYWRLLYRLIKSEAEKLPKMNAYPRNDYEFLRNNIEGDASNLFADKLFIKSLAARSLFQALILVYGFSP